MAGTPLPRVVIGLVLLAGGAAALEAYQGMGSHRQARRIKPIETTLPPITVDFRDARQRRTGHGARFDPGS